MEQESEGFYVLDFLKKSNMLRQTDMVVHMNYLNKPVTGFTDA